MDGQNTQTENNQSEAPQTPDQAPAQKVKPPPLYGVKIKGRYGRLSFVSGFVIAAVLIPSALFGAMYYSNIMNLQDLPLFIRLIMAFIAFLSLFYHIRAGILRLHDLNHSGYFISIPIACMLINGLEIHTVSTLAAMFLLVFYGYLFFKSGSKGENTFGFPPERGSYLGLIIMWVFIIIYWQTFK